MTMITKGQIFATHFPSNPTVGQIAIVHGMKYSWTGILWKEVGATSILPWDPYYVPYAASSFATYANAIWRSTAQTSSVPGVDSTWQKISFTQQEIETIAGYSGGGGGGSGGGGSSPLSCDIDSVVIDEWFSPMLVLNDMGTPDQAYVLQTVTVTGTDSVRLDGRAAFRNTNTTDLVNITMELFMNGSAIDTPNAYLGAVVPPATGGMHTQIPVTISKIVTGLNPSSTYTFTLIGKKQQAVGPVNVLDAYLCASMETITCTGGGGTAGWNSVTTCPVTGPTAGADTTLMYKSALGEYWVYMGDSWRVISGHYVANGTVIPGTAGTIPPAGNTETPVTTFTVPRAGKIDIVSVVRFTMAADGECHYHSKVRHNGTTISYATTLTTDDGSVVNQGYSGSSTVLSLQVNAGDTIQGILSRNITANNATIGGCDLRVRYVD